MSEQYSVIQVWRAKGRIYFALRLLLRNIAAFIKVVERGLDDYDVLTLVPYDRYVETTGQLASPDGTIHVMDDASGDEGIDSTNIGDDSNLNPDKEE